MDVRHDEISIGQLQIGRHRGCHDAGNAADDEHHDEAGEIEEGRVTRAAVQIVATQAKTATALGMVMTKKRR